MGEIAPASKKMTKQYMIFGVGAVVANIYR